MDLHGDLDTIAPVWASEIEHIRSENFQTRLTQIYGKLGQLQNIWTTRAETISSSKGAAPNSMDLMDTRTALQRILSGAVDDGLVELAFLEGACKLYDQMLAIATVLRHPAMWILSLETLINHIAHAPLVDHTTEHLLQQIFLTMRFGLTIAIVMSDSARSTRHKHTTQEEQRTDAILKGISFIVDAQHGLCSRFDCRRRLFVHTETQPHAAILNDRLNQRQLTTSATFTRMGHREIVIKGNMGFPPALIRASVGPCPWVYLLMCLTRASMAALVRVTRFEHRYDKYQRDRPKFAYNQVVHRRDLGDDD